MTNQTAAINISLKTSAVDNHAEQQLALRASRGDRDAFGELYECTFDRIYRYIFFRISDEDTAEDLASKVYLKAWENLPRFQFSNAPFIAWLYTIAHNTVIDHYRTNRQLADLGEANAVPDRQPLPQEQCEQRQDTEILREALRYLTPVQQDVVTMKLIDGMTTDEVAAQIHKTRGPIRALQMRGLQSLARYFQDGRD